MNSFEIQPKIQPDILKQALQNFKRVEEIAINHKKQIIEICDSLLDQTNQKIIKPIMHRQERLIKSKQKRKEIEKAIIANHDNFRQQKYKKKAVKPKTANSTLLNNNKVYPKSTEKRISKKQQEQPEELKVQPKTNSVLSWFQEVKNLMKPPVVLQTTDFEQPKDVFRDQPFIYPFQSIQKDQFSGVLGGNQQIDKLCIQEELKNIDRKSSFESTNHD